MTPSQIYQAPGSRVCGQCCVAMAAGVPLSKVIEVMGHDHQTKGVELIRALRALGVEVCGDRMKHYTGTLPLPPRCIMRIRMQRYNGNRLKDAAKSPGFFTHFVLRWDGRDYDPSGQTVYWINRHPFVTSYVELAI